MKSLAEKLKYCDCAPIDVNYLKCKNTPCDKLNIKT